MYKKAVHYASSIQVLTTTNKYEYSMSGLSTKPALTAYNNMELVEFFLFHQLDDINLHEESQFF
jgi:hypothetical protein